MISIFLLILISAIPLPEIAGAEGKDGNGTGEGSPMVMVRTTLKTWHSMYNSYREEINLGYCWADYFLDVKRLLSTLAGPRLLGLNPDDPSPLIAILRDWFDDGKVEKSSTQSKTQVSSVPDYNSVEENYDDYDCGDQELSYDQGTQSNPCSKWNTNSDQFAAHQREQPPGYNVPEDPTAVSEKPFRYFYPGTVENFGRSFSRQTESSYEDIPGLLKTLVLKVAGKYGFRDRKSGSRALGDLFVSVLGLDVPPGLGPLMIGVRGVSPVVIIVSRIIGTFMRVGRQVLDTIDKTSILACSKEYLLVKFFRWIDS